MEQKTILRSADDAKRMIEETMLQGRNFAPAAFPSGATLYRAHLRGGFVATMINRPDIEIDFWVAPDRDRYTEIFNWLRKLSGYEEAFWFYATDRSGDKKARTDLHWVKAARKHNMEAPLSAFESEPTPVGGDAYLGLLSASAKWLLLHSHHAGAEEFAITIHGQAKLCQDLCRLLKCSSGPGFIEEEGDD